MSTGRSPPSTRKNRNVVANLGYPVFGWIASDLPLLFPVHISCIHAIAKKISEGKSSINLLKLPIYSTTRTVIVVMVVILNFFSHLSLDKLTHKSVKSGQRFVQNFCYIAAPAFPNV